MYCRSAKALGADIALFPEMWNIGYSSFVEVQEDIWRAPELWKKDGADHAPSDPEERRKWQAEAVSPDSPFVTHYRSLAKELEMAIALTYLEKWEAAPRNSVSLIDRHGEIRMTYAKVHTCDFDEPEDSLTPGDDFKVCSLDTGRGDVMVGAMICYDREYPESARILMLKGAELILTPNSCKLEATRLGQFKVRAYENMVGVAMANYASPQCNGHSVAYDPITFDSQGCTRDTLILEAGENEGVFLAEFDMDKIREWRRRETWGNAFRKPHRYDILTSLEVKEPFIRTNSEGKTYDRAKR
jgi:predicted amidohydrolase